MDSFGEAIHNDLEESLDEWLDYCDFEDQDEAYEALNNLFQPILDTYLRP